MGDDKFSAADGNVSIAFGSRPHTTRSSLRKDQEYLYIEAKSISFFLLASHAGNEFPNDMQKAQEHLHLDFIVNHMTGEDQFTGALAELWGIQPRSEEVIAMLTPPSL